MGMSNLGYYPNSTTLGPHIEEQRERKSESRRAMDGSFNQERVQSDIDLQPIFMGNSVSFYGTPILV